MPHTSGLVYYNSWQRNPGPPGNDGLDASGLLAAQVEDEDEGEDIDEDEEPHDEDINHIIDNQNIIDNQVGLFTH